MSTSTFLPSLFDHEIAMLRAGAKRVIKMEFAAYKRVAHAEALGFVCRSARGTYGIETESADITYDAGEAVTFFVGQEADVTEALEVEAVERSASGDTRLEAMRAMGLLLGYPPCCTAAYMTQEDQGESASFARLLGNTGHASGHFANNLFVLEHQLISHFPCTLDCAESAALSMQALALCRADNPRHASSLSTLLKSPIQVWDRFRFLINHPDGKLTARNICSFHRVLQHPSFLSFEAAQPNLPEGGTRVNWR
jgi:hypothetical protein